MDTTKGDSMSSILKGSAALTASELYCYSLVDVKYMLSPNGDLTAIF